MEDNSSVITGDSTQLKLEGQWDETISLDDINKCIIEHLHDKLVRLKSRYAKLKAINDHDRVEHLEKKIVAARINYQRYVNVTKDVIQRCNDFVRIRRDTPGTRIAFIRNVQGYFSQAKEFIKLDISLKKISPTLFTYIQPRTTDSPNTFKRKRELCRVMTNIINNDKGCLINSGVGKIFRSRYAQQTKFIHSEFPDSWLQYLPIVLRNSLKNIPEHDKRWAITILYVLSKHCTVNYLQQGYCPSCLFPIINQRSQGTVGGKLYCPGCKKEIEWTYYMNPRTICIILSGFHLTEIDSMISDLKANILRDPENFIPNNIQDNFFEDILDEYMKNTSEYIGSKPLKIPDPSITVDKKTKHESTNDNDSDSLSCSDNESSTSCQTSDEEYVFPSLTLVTERVMNCIKHIYGEAKYLDNKTIKDMYNMYKEDIQNFEGVCNEAIPRGLIPKVERYVKHYFKLPPKEEIRKREFNAKGDRVGTNRKMIYDALGDLTMTKYYCLVTVIANKLWGSKIPSIAPNHLSVIVDCIVQKEVFNRMTFHGRKANLNQKLILMYILKRHGYAWDEEDFNVTYNRTTISKHLDILRDIFTVIYPPKA